MLKALERAGSSEEEYLDLILQQANKGDKGCRSELNKMLYPPYKPYHETLQVSGAGPGATASEISENLILGVANGQYPPDVVANLLSAISQVRRANEIPDIVQHLKSLGDILDRTETRLQKLEHTNALTIESKPAEPSDG